MEEPLDNLREIQQVALHDPIVFASLTAYITGRVSFEKALVGAVVALAHERRRLFDQLVHCMKQLPVTHRMRGEEETT